MTTEQGLSIEVVWYDDDMVELRAVVANASFRGEATFYEALDFAAEAARAFAGFPRDPQDARLFELGSHANGGGLRVRFACVDGSAHAEASIELTDSSDRSKPAQSAVLRFPIEAAAVDALARELEGFSIAVGTHAVLRAAV